MPNWKKFGILAVGICAITVAGQPQNASGKHGPISYPAQHNAPSAYTYQYNCGTAQEHEAGGKELHWYTFLQDSNWWLVIVAALTGFAVASQAIHTRRAADASLAQLHAATSRERAVINVQPKGMGVIADLHRDYWFLESEIGLRNVGMGRAHILNGKASIKLRFDREKPRFEDAHTDNFKIVDDFVPANMPPESPIVEKFLYMVQGLSVTEQADQIFPGTVVPYISGFVEYATAGTAFRRNFHYSWNSRGRNRAKDFLFYRALYSIYPNTPPSDQERICAGTWIKESEGNEEYELRPKLPPGLWAKTRSFLEELSKEDA
jgi:hypothetical protein